jgi:hypothetical protein
MINKILFSVFFFFAVNVLYAQVNSGLDAQDNLNQLGGMGNIVRVMPPMKEGTKGSPLLFEDAFNATPYRNGRNLNDARFNFHLAENKLLILNRNGLNYIDKLDLDSLLFTDSNRLFVNGNHLDNGVNQKIFEKITTKDGQNLYVEHLVQFIPANFQGAYSGGNNYDEFVKKLNIFIMNDGKLKSIKINAKWLKQNFSDYKKIEDYIYQYELKYNVYEDLNKIINQMR